MMRCARVAFGLLLLGAAAAQAQRYVISTYAGGPSPPGVDPNVSNDVQRVATDASGNAYFTSGSNCNCVFKLDPNGVLTRVAGTPGTSQRGPSGGDGGPATSAPLGVITGVAVDSAGNLYILESSNYRVRKVSPGGIITTVAGNGSLGFSGDGGPATSGQLGEFLNDVAVDGAGNLFIVEGVYQDPCGGAAFGNNRIRRVSPDGIITTVAGDGTLGISGDGGPATSAQLSGPGRVAADSGGNLFFSELYGRIRKVSPDGIIRTVVDPTSIPDCLAVAYCYTGSVTLDQAGNLVFTENGGGWGTFFGVFKLSAGGIITTVLGKDAPVGAGFGFSSVAVDGAGNLLLADGSTLRKVSPDGLITTLAGYGACCYSGDGGPASRAQLNHTSSVAADRAGTLFIADTDNHRIRRVSPDGIITTVAGNGRWSLGCAAFSGDSGPATAAELCRPARVAVGAGNLFIVDGYRIRKVSPDGTIAPVAGNGTCCYSGDGGPATAAQLSPIAVAADGAGNLFISDETDRVRRVSPDGIITTVAGNGTRGFSGDGGLATDAQLAHAIDLAVDSAGNLYIADQANRRIRKVSPDGIITTAAGSGSTYDNRTPSGDGGPATNAPLLPPNGVAVDSAGNLFLSDPFRIRKVSPDGIITAVAGTFFMPGYSGDGGPATSARFWNSTGVAADAAGNVYVADTFNNVVRILRPIR